MQKKQTIYGLTRCFAVFATLAPPPAQQRPLQALKSKQSLVCRPGNSVSFLNQLKSQASALQVQQRSQAQSFDANVAQTESACLKTWHDLSDLARQVNRKKHLAGGRV